MGTSSSFWGPGGNTPLVPSWLGGDGNNNPTPDTPSGNPPASPDTPPTGSPPPPQTPLPPAAASNRFTAARSNFSRFAASGGRDRASLGRAISHYVSTSAGGARTAATRMGTSREAGGRFLGFLSDTVSRGSREALRALNFESLAGRPIEQIFLGLADYICPDGGMIDEGIAREAFIETIADLASAGVTDLDSLTAEQMQTVFELYATNAIEARLCNDIGTKTIILPSNFREAEQVQAQLHDFILRAVADAFTRVLRDAQPLTPERIFPLVESTYEQAFNILQIMGDAEADRI